MRSGAKPLPKRDQRFPVFRGIFVSTWIINLGWLANHTCNSGMPIRCSLHDVIVLSTRVSLFSRVYSFCPFPDCTSIASRGKKKKKGCKSCRSRKMLQNASLVAIVAVNTAENEPSEVGDAVMWKCCLFWPWSRYVFSFTRFSQLVA